MNQSKTCWAITDGHTGMMSQVQGLAEAVGLPTTFKTCKRRAPWVWLPATFPGLNPLNQLTQASDRLDPPWPDLLITCGRRQLPYALWIKQHSHGNTFCAHIQNPRIPFHYLDLIIAPEHDGISGENVVSTKGAIHKVTLGKLQDEAKKWQSRFTNFPKPYHVVLLGGSTNRYKMTESAMQGLIDQIKGIAEQTHGSVLVTPSFRTPYLDMLRNQVGSLKRVYLADPSQENPYLGMLGLAEYIYVTDDSVNMMCEANMTGKPLYLLTPKGHKDTTPAKFGVDLIADGIARPYEGKIENWSYTPVNDTQRAANEIRQRLGL